MENFPPKLENFPPLQNVPIHAILQKIFFFLQLFESGKFSTKVEKIPISLLGMEFGKREGLDAENKISPKWKIFHQKWKIFDLCRMFQFMQFCKKIFFFCRFLKVENFPPKWKNFQFLHLDWIWARLEVQKSEKIFTKVEVFPIKMENFPTLQNVPIHVILE